MATWIRRIVSGQKKRFQDDGFDLDLAYISPRVVAMGLPAERAEMLYRNPMPEIARFLQTYHKKHAKVYNLCSEHAYGPDKLLTALQHYPFDDHQTPALLVVQQFCEDAAAWLAAHAHNVVVVHCKAGKGRTGIMICCLLLYLHIHAPDLANLPAADVATGSNEAGSDAGVDTADADAGSVSSISSAGSSRGWHPWQTVPAVQLKELRNPVKDVLALYADQRTHDGNGVTIASQRRYVAYFWRWLSAGNTAPFRTVQLRELMISGLPSGSADACCVVVEARPSGSTAASASRVLTCSQPQAMGSGSLQGLCLAPCTAEPLVCEEDSCCHVRVSSSTAGDSLTICMPAASMGLSMIAAKHQQQHQQHVHHVTAATAAAADEAAVAVLPPDAATAAQQRGCAACVADLGCGCLGCGRLSAAVLPEPVLSSPVQAPAAGQYSSCSTAVVSAGDVTAEAAAAGLTAEASDSPGGGDLEPSDLGDPRGCCVVEGDVRVMVMRGGTRLFYTWFNTAYLPDSGCYSLSKRQLDKPNKLLPDDVRLTVRFVDMQPHVEVEEGEAPAAADDVQKPPAQLPQEEGDESELFNKSSSASSGWAMLRNRVLRSSKSSRGSDKKSGTPAAGGTARCSGSHPQQAGRGVDDLSPALAMAREAVAPVTDSMAADAGGSAALPAKQPAPMILTSSSSLSALSNMVQECGQDQQQQQHQAPLQNCLSAPATPQAGAGDGSGGAKLAPNGSWNWQHLPAISSISSTFWDWAASEGARGRTMLAGMSSTPSQDKLSWDWDWNSLASVVPAASVSSAATASAVDAVVAGPPAPSLMQSSGSAATSAPASPASSWAASRLQVALQPPDPLPVPWKARKPARTRVSMNGTMMQDQLSSLSRSPAAIELPLLPKHGVSKASSTVDALLDPVVSAAAVSAATSTHAVLNGQQQQQQQQHRPGSRLMVVRSSGGISTTHHRGQGPVHSSKLATARKPFSLWPQLRHQEHGRQLAQSGDAAEDVAGRAGHLADQSQPAAADAAGSRCRAAMGRSRSFDATVCSSEASSTALSGAAGPVCDADGESALDHVDVCSPLLESALPAAAAEGLGNSEPFQDLLNALNWSTNGSKHPSAAHSIGGSGSNSSGVSSYFQPRRRHTYSGQAVKSGGTSVTLGISKVHSAPCTPGQQQQGKQSAGTQAQVQQAQSLVARLLDLEAVDDEIDDEVDGAGVACRLWVQGAAQLNGSAAASHVAAAGEAATAAWAGAGGGAGGGADQGGGAPQQSPRCLECVFGLHKGACPAAGAAVSTTATAVAASAARSGQHKVFSCGGSRPADLADSAPFADSQISDSVRAADAAAVACRPQLPTDCRKGVRSSSSQSGSGPFEASTISHGSAGVAGVGKRKSCNAYGHSSCWGGAAGSVAGVRRRGDPEQLRSLLAADDESDISGGNTAAEGPNNGPPASITQQWKQLEKAWQRNWWV